MQPTETQITQCETKFFDYCKRYGYSKAVGVMSREFSGPEESEIWKATQCQTKTKAPAVSDNAATAHKADSEAVKASGRYSDLHANTGA